MRQHHNPSQEGPQQYQTGPTAPPKSRGGIAFLLILVIFLFGIVSILSMMNIRLFQMLKTQQSQALSLQQDYESQVAPAQALPKAAQTQAQNLQELGIWVQPITAFYQQYYQIPQGLFIDQVDQTGPCYAQGLRSGDILQSINDIPLADLEALNRILEELVPGQQLELVVYRGRDYHNITILFQGD